MTLDGPSQSSKGGAFSPSTFVLYSGSTKLYTFEVSKWFIAQVGQSNGYTYTQDFCKNLGPSENYYHIPSIFDYTNSSYPSMGWVGPVNQINYRRAIGGGLFAEWGNTANTYYTNSDWVEMNYWGVESINDGDGPQFISNSRYGYVISTPPDSRFIMGSCVTP